MGIIDNFKEKKINKIASQEYNKINSVTYFDDDTTISEVLNNFSGLDPKIQKRIIEMKIDNFNYEDFSGIDLENLLINTADEVKIELLNNDNMVEKLKSNLDSLTLSKVIQSMPEEKRVEMAVKFQDRLDSWFIGVIQSVSEEKRVEMLEKFQDKLDSSYLSALIKSVSEEKRVEILEKFQDKLVFSDLGIIIESIPKEKRAYIVDKFVKQKEVFGKTEIKRKINLPKGMTIGIEIEAESRYNKFGHLDLLKYINSDWKVKADGSLSNGLEFVSDILTGTLEDTQKIYLECEVLKKMKYETSERCGGHVHIGADFLKNKQAYLNLLEIWGNSEEILYNISNESGEITRQSGIEKYATPISNKLEKVLSKGTINLEAEKDLDSFVAELRWVQGSRYSGINFMNTGNINKNTVEFRLANGTLNPETWIENINLFGGIVGISQRISEIQSKDPTEITEEEKNILEDFEKIKNNGLEKDEKLNSLLNLTVKEEDKSIYEERYAKNSKIFNENPKLNESLKKQIASKIEFKESNEKFKILPSGIEATIEGGVRMSTINEEEKKVERATNNRENPEIDPWEDYF